MSELIKIPGAPKNPYVLRPDLCYVYERGNAEQSCRCPGCGGLGMPWMGWFRCEDCPLVALVEDGQCFAPTESSAAKVPVDRTPRG